MAVEDSGALAREIVLRPIGYVDSRYAHYHEVPRPDVRRGWTADLSRVVLYPEHAAKIEGLRGYSHVIILYWIHKAGEWRMPRDHGKPPRVRLFATRMPKRPNPIGLSVVELLAFFPEGGYMTVRGLDALKGSPLLDIKPYIPDLDSFPEASLPDWVKVHLRDHHHPHIKK